MPRFCIIPSRALTDDRIGAKLLRALCAVGMHAGRDGRGVWASSRTLADAARLDHRDLRRALSDLERFGYLRRVRRTTPHGGDYQSELEVLLDDPVGGEEGQITPGEEGQFAPGEEGWNAPGGGGANHPGGEGRYTPGGEGSGAPGGRGVAPRGRRGAAPPQTSNYTRTTATALPRARGNSDQPVQPRRSDPGLSAADLAELDWLDEPAEPEVALDEPEVPLAGVLAQGLAAPPELTEPVHRAAWDGIVRSAPAPVAVAASIGALASGLHGPGGKAVPWPVIGQALLELQAAAVPFSPAALRAFARRLEAPDPPPRVPTPRYGLPAIGPREETWDEVEARYKRQWAAEDAAAAAREAAQNVAQAADSPGGHRSPSLPAERAPAATPAPALTGLVGAVARAFAIPVAPGVRHVA